MEWVNTHLVEQIDNDPDRFRHFDFLQDVKLLIVVGQRPRGPVSKQVLPGFLYSKGSMLKVA